MLKKEEKEVLLERFKEDIGEAHIDTYAYTCKKLSDVNYSSILTKLIQEAGSVCTHYASDLFISWESLVNDLKEVLETKEKETWNESYFFGFRDMGVDHDCYIYNRVNSPEVYGFPYESIYRLDIACDRKNPHYETHYDVKMDLYAVYKNQDSKK